MGDWLVGQGQAVERMRQSLIDRGARCTRDRRSIAAFTVAVAVAVTAAVADAAAVAAGVVDIGHSRKQTHSNNATLVTITIITIIDHCQH